MDTVFQNEYLTIKVDKNKSIYYWDWTPKSEEMTSEMFLAQGAKLLEEFLKSNCRLVIDNGLNSRFAITTDLQEIIAKQMLNVLNGKVDKVAHVLPEEIIVGLSTEQLWDENMRTYNEKYFTNLIDANKWINE